MVKKLALCGFLCLGSVAFADTDLLQNSDFSSGIAHWEGDCHSAGSEEATPSFVTSTAAVPQGVTVTLRSHDWTKVTQDFEGKAGEYLLTVSYSFSPDLKFSTDGADYANIPGSTGMSRFKPFAAEPGQWVVILNDLGSMKFHYWKIMPQAGAATQTFTSKATLETGDTAEKTICLVFPPGTGTVTLLQVGLTGP
jgi:hypothetical protein